MEEKRKELINAKRNQNSDFKTRHNAFVKRATKGLSPPEFFDYLREEHELLGPITAQLINYKKILKSVGIEPGRVYRGRKEKPISENTVKLEIHAAKQKRERYLLQTIFEHKPHFFETHTTRNRRHDSGDEDYGNDTEQVFDLGDEDTAFGFIPDTSPIPSPERSDDPWETEFLKKFEELKRKVIILPSLGPDDDEPLPRTETDSDGPIELPDLGESDNDEAIGVNLPDLEEDEDTVEDFHHTSWPSFEGSTSMVIDPDTVYDVSEPWYLRIVRRFRKPSQFDKLNQQSTDELDF